MTKNKGFTLIELLVVISIIALLMAILMPALAKAKRQAKAVACLSNLKQWGYIAYLYTSDNGDRLPAAVGGGDNWLGVSRPYVQDEKIRLCPMATRSMSEGARQPFAANDTQRSGYKGSYGFHDWVTSYVKTGTSDKVKVWNSKLWMTTNVKGGARVPVIAGCVRLYLVNPEHNDEPPAYESDVIFGSGTAGGETKNYCVNRHNGYMNGAFLDFSARKIGLKEIWELEWHRNWNPNNDPPPVWPDWMQGFKDYY